MPSFVWKGRMRTGQLQEGQLLADTRDAAVAMLKRQQIQITSIREKGREIKLMPRLRRGVSAKRVAIFTLSIGNKAKIEREYHAGGQNFMKLKEVSIRLIFIFKGTPFWRFNNNRYRIHIVYYLWLIA